MEEIDFIIGEYLVWQCKHL